MSNPDLPLVFSLDGQTIHPGYHVTEVKHAVINSLDCGRGNDQWDEISVQLLDGHANFKQGYMSCAKFMSIVGKAIALLSFNEDTLTFIEFSPNNEGLRKLVINSIAQEADQVIIQLSNASAECKAFKRALAGKLTATNEACC